MKEGKLEIFSIAWSGDERILNKSSGDAEGISSESLQDPAGEQLGGVEKSVKDDSRFLAGACHSTNYQRRQEQV